MASSSGEVIRELLVAIGIDADTAAVEDFDEAVDKAKGHLENLVDIALAAAAAVAALTYGLVSAASDTGAYAETVEAQAAALGLSTEAYQELLYAADATGVSAESLGKTLQQLNGIVQDAGEGSEESIALLEKLGLTYDDLAGKSPDEQLAILADALAGIEDPAERLQVATDLLGDRLALELLPLLEGGSAGLADMAEQAQELGIVMSEEDLAAASEFDDAMDQLTATMEGLWRAIGLEVLPILQELIGDFLEWVQANREVIGERLDVWFDQLATILRAVADGLAAADAALGAEGWAQLAELIAFLAGAAGFIAVAVEVAGFVSAVWGGVAALAAMVGGGEILLALLAGLVTTVGMIVGPWLAFVLVLEDFYTYLSGGDSVIGRFIERFREAEGFLGAVARLVENLGQLLPALFAAGQTALAPFIGGLELFFGLWLEFASFMATTYLEVINFALETLAPLIDGMATVAGLVASATGSEVPTAGTGSFASTDSAATAAGLAPTSSAALAPTSSTSSSSSSSSAVTVGGDTITISGVGMSLEEVTVTVERLIDEKLRAAMAAMAGAEV